MNDGARLAAWLAALAAPVDLRGLHGYGAHPAGLGLLLFAAMAGLAVWLRWWPALSLFALLLLGYWPLYLGLAAARAWRPRQDPLLLVVVVLLVAAVLSGVLASLIVDVLTRHWRLHDMLRAPWDWLAASTFALLVTVPELWQLHREQAQSRWISERQRLADLERALLQARLHALQAQVEPHFLYNTLATVQAAIGSQPALAERVLQHFVAYLRSALPQLREPQSTIGRECRLVSDYLAIMEIRMGGRLSYDVDCPEHCDELPFPPMMLISLVENAVRHGAEPKRSATKISVRVSVADGGLQACVSDDGAGLRQPASAGGVGLSNIRQRLQGLYGAAATLQLQANAAGGVDASLVLPQDARA